MTKQWASQLLVAAALLIFLAMGLWNLGGPLPWWDEGWTLSVARNVAERGIYARLLDGQPSAHGLEAAIPITEAVALSFKLLGVGLWQGRVPGVLCGAVALGLLFLVASRAYDRSVAWAAMLGTVLLAGHPQLNLLIMARQVLGEVPMLAALLGALLCVEASGRGRYRFLPLAIVLGALTMQLKAQAQPFWIAGLLCGFVAALLLRQRRYIFTLAATLAGSLLLFRPLLAVFEWFARPLFPASQLTGILEITGLVLDLGNRSFTLLVVALFGLPTMLGVLYATWKWWQEYRSAPAEANTLVLRAVLLGMVGSWTVWFLTLSSGMTRYLFPMLFLGSIFAAVLLRDLTSGFDLPGTVRQLALTLTQRRLTRTSASAWLAMLLVALAFSLSMVALSKYYLLATDDSVLQVARLLNASAPTSRIETYESELHFLLDRSYVYPPDQTQVSLTKRWMLGQNVPLNYDPLAADPDYLVIGQFAHGSDLYRPSIAAGHFRLIEQIGRYEVYARVRP